MRFMMIYQQAINGSEIQQLACFGLGRQVSVIVLLNYFSPVSAQFYTFIHSV